MKENMKCKKKFSFAKLSFYVRWNMVHFLFFFMTCFSAFSWDTHSFEKVVYDLHTDPIDVVIPCAPKDVLTLEKCIEGIQKNGKNIRRIIVVSKEKLTSSAEWFSEELFPFSKKDVALEIFKGNEREAQAFIDSPKTRIGWIFQQLLKFYIPFVIPDISRNVLILDSDVIFLNPVTFVNEKGIASFIPATEYVKEYFDHASKFLPGLRRVQMGKSGIAHHMLFQKEVLEDLFHLVETYHQKDLWKAMCFCIDMNELYKSSMSEYEIYFNFIQLRTNQWHLSNARWMQISQLNRIEYYKRSNHAFIVCPEWYRSLAMENRGVIFE